MSQDYNFFEIWKDLYSQSSKFFDEKMNQEFPSQGMGQVLEMNLQFKKMMDESTKRYLEFVNVPTRNDLANISSMIVSVDAKVDELEDLLEETVANKGDQGSLKSELANVKKEMKGLDNKLNQILTLLKPAAEKK